MVYHVNTADEYEALKASPDRLVVVDFSAKWCGPCRAIAPRFKELCDLYPEAVFVHVDIDVLGDLPDVEDVQGVPTFKFFKNDQLLHRFSGANAAALEKAIAENI